jgi:DNA-binding XRE family transcriptional regulator
MMHGPCFEKPGNASRGGHYCGHPWISKTGHLATRLAVAAAHSIHLPNGSLSHCEDVNPRWIGPLRTISDLGIFRKAGSTCPVAKSIYSEEYREFRELLKRLRVEAGIRQVDLAAQLGVPQSFISKYESGERRLDVIETARIAEAIGSSLLQVVRLLESRP